MCQSSVGRLLISIGLLVGDKTDTFGPGSLDLIDSNLGSDEFDAFSSPKLRREMFNNNTALLNILSTQVNKVLRVEGLASSVSPVDNRGGGLEPLLPRIPLECLCQSNKKEAVLIYNRI